MNFRIISWSLSYLFFFLLSLQNERGVLLSSFLHAVLQHIYWFHLFFWPFTWYLANYCTWHSLSCRGGILTDCTVHVLLILTLPSWDINRPVSALYRSFSSMHILRIAAVIVRRIFLSNSSIFLYLMEWYSVPWYSEFYFKIFKEFSGILIPSKEINKLCLRCLLYWWTCWLHWLYYGACMCCV